MISKPDFDFDGKGADRRKVIIDSYYRARENGDRNVYFIDGETLFRGFGEDSCTVDSTHPNDLGFFRMAEAITAVLTRIIRDGNLPKEG